MNNPFIRVPLQQRILFTKSLALSLKSGVSLVNSLAFIKKQVKSKSLKSILDSLIKDAENGIFLSVGLLKFRNVFGDLFINIVKVAEASGTLPENLIYLGEELKKKHELRKKVRGALIYPIIILIATIGIAASMILFVFPKILPIFQGSKVELPLTTRLLIKFSDFITHYGILALIGAILFIVAFRFSLRFKSFQYYVHQSMFYIPILGGTVVSYNMTNLTRTLGLLLRSGIKIVEALSITADTLSNAVYRNELKKAGEYVQRGEFFSKYLALHEKKFPTTVSSMISVGENTGNLTDNLFYLAEYYEGEVDDFVRNLSSILEPVLLLFMGGIVGFIALSFITPIYQLTKSF